MVNEEGPVRVRTTGTVTPDMPELARRRVAAVLRHVGEPVLFANVMLVVAPDPAVERPAIAWATVSVNGRVVRAHATGTTMPQAIGALAARLRIRVDRAWSERDHRRWQAQAGQRRVQRRV